MFDQLKGIQAGREVKPREESVLEKLLEAGVKVASNDEIKQIMSRYKNARTMIQLIVDKFDLNYDNEILNQLINATSYKFEDDESKEAFGIYTGCLATRLYNENNKTIIHINGAELDYILMGLEKANKVIIENCKGDFIGSYIGSWNGNVRSVIIKKVTGEWPGWFIGSDEGNVEEVIINESTIFYKENYKDNCFAKEIIIDGVLQ